MTHARTVTLALGAALLIAAPALAQTGASAPSAPTLTPTPPVGVPSTIDPRTGLPSSQTPIDPRTGLPSSSPGVFTSPTAPLPAPPPVPQTGPPRPSPPAGQPITPSTVDPRTGLPR